MPPLAEWHRHPWLLEGCEPGAAPLRVAVLVSGGVDSSVALALASAAGHSVRAFYLQIWFQEDFRNFWDACPWEEDLAYAREVCEGLGVDLEVVPLSQQYWERVVTHCVGEIRAGRTPNPDVLCNSRVKFGAFFEVLQQRHAGEFDRVVSGHYARVVRRPATTATTHNPAAAAAAAATAADGPAAAEGPLAQRRASHAAATTSGGSSSHTRSGSGSSHRSSSQSGGSGGGSEVRLMLTPDPVKDQTYFLCHLSAQQLARCMFPLGPFTKPQVRALARAAGLATSARRDSQGICFLGKVRFSEFVKEHLGEWPGLLVERETGAALGVHQGYWFYTVGQRGGIQLPGGPWYVVGKDVRLNIITISRREAAGAAASPSAPPAAFVCGPLHWLGADRPDADPAAPPLLVKVRHAPRLARCSVQVGSVRQLLPPEAAAAAGGGVSALSGEGAEEGYARVELEEADEGLAPGQYAALYQGGVCLGSGVIVCSLPAAGR